MSVTQWLNLCAGPRVAELPPTWRDSLPVLDAIVSSNIISGPRSFLPTISKMAAARSWSTARLSFRDSSSHEWPAPGLSLSKAARIGMCSC